jgi:hypothetical protein
MAGIPVTFGPLRFDKKGDAEKHLMNMLNGYDVGDKVSDDDAVVLAAVLERHPEATDKIGSGLSHFSVRSADFNTKCFWINRIDGTTEKFSFRACIYGRRSRVV